MAKNRAYPLEFRSNIIELVRSGKSVSAVAKKYSVARLTIVNWLKQDDVQAGGCQYTSIAFSRHYQDTGVQLSTGSVGDCYGNAMCESSNATLECELLDRHRFRNPREAQLAIFDFIDGWYNPHRRHWAIGNISPMGYERRSQASPRKRVSSIHRRLVIAFNAQQIVAGHGGARTGVLN